MESTPSQPEKKKATKSDPFSEEYICTKCGNKQIIESTKPVVCTQCHCRIFRKIKTPYIVQYTAR
jgi:DNA-directed RNA polymerase subunit RPC12/RpoP